MDEVWHGEVTGYYDGNTVQLRAGAKDKTKSDCYFYIGGCAME